MSPYRDVPNNISSRDKTSAAVVWSGAAAWTVEHEAGPDQRTPDLTAIVEEIIARPDWEEGNAMAFILEGMGRRSAESFDGVPALAPALHVNFIGEQTSSSVDKIRLSWSNDPTTTMTVIWDQIRGSGAEVYYDAYDPEEGCSHDLADYRFSQAPQRSVDYRGMSNQIATLTNLMPDNDYRFVIAAGNSVSDCLWFRTAPDFPKPFAYITGGDTKSSGNPLQAGRWSNQMVAKLRPLFVLFTGDFNSGDGTNDARWQQWLSDWSEGARSADGRMYPIIAVHGNHEDGDFEVLYNLFDSGNQDGSQPNDYSYYGLSFGGDLLHVINLNSQFYLNGMPTAHDQQTTWLEAELQRVQDFSFKVAGYGQRQ